MSHPNPTAHQPGVEFRASVPDRSLTVESGANIAEGASPPSVEPGVVESSGGCDYPTYSAAGGQDAMSSPSVEPGVVDSSGGFDYPTFSDADSH